MIISCISVAPESTQVGEWKLVKMKKVVQAWKKDEVLSQTIRMKNWKVLPKGSTFDTLRSYTVLPFTPFMVNHIPPNTGRVPDLVDMFGWRSVSGRQS
jgi:hypothetical protein